MRIESLNIYFQRILKNAHFKCSFEIQKSTTLICWLQFGRFIFNFVNFVFSIGWLVEGTLVPTCRIVLFLILFYCDIQLR